MWYCNGDLDSDCCMTFDNPDVQVDSWGNVICTCPFCGAIAEPADADGEAMLQEIIDELIGR